MGTYQEFPTRRLERYIECCWSRADQHGTRRDSVLPDGCVEILYSSRGGEPIGVSIVGLMTVQQLIDVESGVVLFGVRFRPGMAAAFFPDVPHLIDRIEQLESVIGAGARTILEQLSVRTARRRWPRFLIHYLGHSNRRAAAKQSFISRRPHRLLP